MRFRGIGSLLAYRRLVKALDRLVDGVEAQNRLFARLVDHLAPSVPMVEDLASTGADYLPERDMALALEYIDRTRRDTGHTPSDEEVLEFLADALPQDHQQRLNEQAGRA